jgi:uncharacterized protein YegP (UPF0339 family)
MGKFVVIRATNGEYYFNLKADSSQIILTSHMYSSKSVCFNGIESVKNNCSDDSRYECNQSANNKHYFVLMAFNGQILGNSEMYETKAEMEIAIESVKKNGSNTSVVEEEPYF